MKQKGTNGGGEEEAAAINLGRFMILPEEHERLAKEQQDEQRIAMNSAVYFRWKMNALDEAQLIDMIRKEKRASKASLPKIQIFDPKKYVSEINPAPGDYDVDYGVTRKHSPKVFFEYAKKGSHSLHSHSQTLLPSNQPAPPPQQQQPLQP